MLEYLVLQPVLQEPEQGQLPAGALAQAWDSMEAVGELTGWLVVAGVVALRREQEQEHGEEQGQGELLELGRLESPVAREAECCLRRA